MARRFGFAVLAGELDRAAAVECHADPGDHPDVGDFRDPAGLGVEAFSRLSGIQKADLFGADGESLSVAVESIRDADEIGHELVDRVFIEVTWRADLLDPSLVEDRDPVTHRQSFVLVVGDIDESDVDLALDLFQLDLHLFAEFEVERSEGLVEQQHPGAVDDGPGESDPLALATGEFGRLALVVIGEPDHLERPADPLLALTFVHLRDFEAVLDVLGHAHVGKERVVLEDGVDLAVVRRKPDDVPSSQFDRAGIRLFKAGDHLQGCCLAGPGRSQ